MPLRLFPYLYNDNSPSPIVLVPVVHKTVVTACV